MAEGNESLSTSSDANNNPDFNDFLSSISNPEKSRINTESPLYKKLIGSKELQQQVLGLNNASLNLDLAGDTNTNFDILTQLVKGGKVIISDTAISTLIKKDLSKEQIQSLANDPNIYLRKIAASNKNSTSDILATLAKDKNPAVRINVLQNPNTPQEIKNDLYNDANMDINMAQKIALIPNLQSETYEKIINKYSDIPTIMGNLAKNTGLTPDLYKKLSETSDMFVLLDLIINKSVPIDIKKHILESPDTPKMALDTIITSSKLSPEVIEIIIDTELAKENIDEDTLNKFIMRNKFPNDLAKKLMDSPKIPEYIKKSINSY